MRSTIAAALTALVAGRAVAQSTVVSLVFPQPTQQALVASVVSANPTAATYVLDCPENAQEGECSLGTKGMTIVQGPETYSQYVEFGGFTADTGCKITNSAAYCIAALTMAPATTASATSTVVEKQAVTLSPLSNYGHAVTITAGASKLISTSSLKPSSISSKISPTPTPNAAPTAAPRGAGIALAAAVLGGVAAAI